MTVQYQGVWTLQNAAQLQSTQRWVTDPLFENTTLLLQADDAANGSQNNTFLDSSSNSFAITRNGNTTQGSFTPFSSQPGAWSNFFGGSGNYVVSNAAVFANTATTFTIEGWIYPTAAAVSASNIPSVIGDMQPVSTAAYWTFGILASGALSFYWYDGASKNATSSGTVPLNTWTHIAVSVNANAITLYINGVQQSLTGTTTLTNRTGSNSSVAFAQFSTTGSVYTGYVSNFSVLSGTAKYSASFTPPVAPLSTGATNQVLLFAYGNNFADFNTATTAKTFTITGTPSVQAFSPFAPQFQWTPSVIGGSGYFDGTGDYLTKSNINFSTNAFTIEGWFYLTSTANNINYWGESNGGGSNPKVLLYMDTANLAFELGTAGGTVVFTPISNVRRNAWQHIVICRSGTGTNQTAMFLDGQRVSAGTSGNLATSTGTFNVGYMGEPYGTLFTGYIASFRVVNGTDVYGAGNTTITVPTAPVTNVSNTNILLNFTNAGIYDATMKNNLETVGNAQISTAVVKYGSGSLAFDGTGDYLDSPSIINAQFGTGDLTIEGWLYLNSLAATQVLFEFRAANGATYGQVYITTGGVLRFYLPTDVGTSNTFSTGVWTHFAITRAAGTLRMFIGGVQGYSASYTSAMDAARLRIGADVSGATALNGYLDDVRFTKGVARYTQNFIPPSVALPRQ